MQLFTELPNPIHSIPEKNYRAPTYRALSSSSSSSSSSL
jgi:hypothetical protein